MPDRMKPKKVSLDKLGSLLQVPEGATVTGVSHDDTEAVIYLSGGVSPRRIPLDELAALIGVSAIGSAGVTDTELIVTADDSAPATTGQKAGS